MPEDCRHMPGDCRNMPGDCRNKPGDCRNTLGDCKNTLLLWKDVYLVKVWGDTSRSHQALDDSRGAPEIEQG